MHHVRRRIGDGPPQVDTAGNPVKRWTDYPVSTRHPGNDVAGGGCVSYLLIKEKVVIVEPEGGTDDGRGSRKMSTLAE